MGIRGFFLIISLMIFTVAFGQKTSKKPIVKTSPYIIHVVKFGETLTRIAQKYGVTITDILKTNPSLTENSLMPEQIIRIPNKGNKKMLTEVKITVNELQPKTAKQKELITANGKYHTVEPGQTLYSISKMYNTKVDDLQKWNNLTDFNLKVGSQLIVVNPESNPNPKGFKEIPTLTKEEIIKNPLYKKNETDIIPVKKTPVEPEITKDIVEDMETETQKPDIQASDNATQKELAKIFKEKTISGSIQYAKGTGAPMTTTLGAMESVYFAMHKWLPIGTIIKIKNLVNSKIVYAKIIGKLPDTDENKHVIVRYSLGIKKDLQLQNGKCYLQIEYPN